MFNIHELRDDFGKGVQGLNVRGSRETEK